MFKYVLAFILFTTSAIAQNAPDNSSPDEYTLERVTDDHYRVDYWNSESLSSTPSIVVMTNGPMTVIATVIPSAGPETLELIVPAGWVAIPESIEVDDGSFGSINIIRLQQPLMLS